MLPHEPHGKVDHSRQSSLPPDSDAELGSFLIEPNSLQLAGCDQLAAKWFGLITEKGIAELCSVSELDQFINISGSTGASDSSFHFWVSALSQSTAQAKTCPAVIHGHHGQSFPANLHACRLASPAGLQLLVTIRPLTNDAGPHAVEHMNSVDALTGLADRRALAPRLALWHQRSPGWPFAVLFLDLNDFKQVNDHYSHASGDRVLQILASRWRQCIRDDQTHGDLLVRYGGDEFVVLLSGIASCEAANPVIERLQSATRQAIDLDGHQFKLTASIGIAISPLNAPADLDALIATADRNMYATKRQ